LGRGLWNHSAMVGDEARVVQAFCVWLAQHGWHTRLQVEHVDVVADRGNQRLYAEANGRAAVGQVRSTVAASSWSTQAMSSEMTDRIRADIRRRQGLPPVGLDEDEAEVEQPPVDMNELIRRGAGRHPVAASDDEDD
jgi:hypothetical protein